MLYKIGQRIDPCGTPTLVSLGVMKDPGSYKAKSFIHCFFSLGPATNESHDIGAQSQTSLASVNSVESSQENAVHKSSKEDLGVKTLSDEVTNSESEANLNVANKGLGVENQAQTSVGAGKTMNDKALNAANQYKDMYNSFTPGLAHYSYVLFCRVLGDHFVSSILYNEDLIWQLCSNFDEGLTLTSNSETPLNDDMQSKDNKATTTVKRKEEDKGERI